MSAVIVDNLIREVASEVRFNFAPDARTFDCKFIEPGLISYRDVGGGIELLRKETIDAAIASAVGTPLTIDHVIVHAGNRMDVEQGIVTEWYFDSADGWFHTKGYADTEKAKSLIRRGQKPSCGYIVNSFGPGGVYHGIRYDKEITSIKFNHLAIVEKPRYENAIFRLNSVPVSNPESMNLFKLLKKLVTRENGADGKVSEATKVESHEVPGTTEVVIDGVSVPLDKLAELHRANSAPVTVAPVSAAADDEIEIDGKPVKVSALVEGYRKNAAAPAGGVKVEAAAAAPVVPAVKTETPEEIAARNNAAGTAAGARVESAAPLKVEAPFFALRNARNNAALEDAAPRRATNSGSILDRVKAGQERYGSAPVIVQGKN